LTQDPLKNSHVNLQQPPFIWGEWWEGPVQPLLQRRFNSSSGECCTRSLSRKKF